jgi:hypothetical protein
MTTLIKDNLLGNAGFQQIGECVGISRTLEKEALALAAVQVLKRCKLAGGLDALGDDPVLEIFGHGDDRAEDAASGSGGIGRTNDWSIFTASI